MADRRANALTNPSIESLLDEVDAKFTLVTLAALRAREINEYYNQLGEGLGRIVPPQVTSVSRKPLSIALEEIEAQKIVAAPNETEVDESESGDEGAPAAEGTGGEGAEATAPSLTILSSDDAAVSNSGEDGAGE